MTLDYVPLLAIQRELYTLPRGVERFRAYLRTMVDPGTGDLALPLPMMNPMGKAHVPALLDGYLAMDTEGAAAQAAQAAATGHADLVVTLRLGLVVADDLKGGWTNRVASEFDHRFETRAYHRRGWIVALLWSSEPPTLEGAVREAAMAVHRGAYYERHGPARTLRQMLAQEGFVAARADCPGPALDGDDLDYTREVLTPLLDRDDRPTLTAALFGDAAARQLGYAPLGLSERAGLALARHDARRTRSTV